MTKITFQKAFGIPSYRKKKLHTQRLVIKMSWLQWRICLNLFESTFNKSSLLDAVVLIFVATVLLETVKPDNENGLICLMMVVWDNYC